MSQSLLVKKYAASLVLNDPTGNDDIILSTKNSQLLVNNVPITSNNNSVTYSTLGNLFALEQVPLTCYTNTVGNKITDSGLLISNLNTDFQFGLANGNSPIGNSTGSVITSKDQKGGLYLGDDGVVLYNQTNISIDADLISFCNSMSSNIYNTYISQGNNLVTQDLESENFTINNLLITGNTLYGTLESYTQITDPTNSITVTSESGIITLFTSTLTSSQSSTFAVSKSALNTNPVLISIQGYTGTTGHPVVYIVTSNTNSFTVRLYNAHNTDPLNGIVTIFYKIIRYIN